MAFQPLYTNIFGSETDPGKVTEKFPYFIPAHFFRLQQTDAGHSDYDAIAAMTALHFANPYLLNEQLSSGSTDEKEFPVANLQTETAAPAAVIAPGDILEESFSHRVEVVEEPVSTQNIAITEKTASVVEQGEATSVETAVTKQEHPPLLFEPLHTTDYFASQGIKLSETLLPGDKMGKQLKSFTEWLKTMKKVHPEGLKEKLIQDSPIDSSVQKLAEKSNQEEEVLTESMAEVYLQQGKTNKAKEIYEKLSLLNPTKSAYFAAKLNEIQ